MRVKTYRDTVLACCFAYVIQAMVINYVPLLFVRFQEEFQINILALTGLVTVNFLVQLLADALSIPIIRLLGYRWTALLAHLLAVLGFIAMAFLPQAMSQPYIALMIATVLYSAGGGLIEVVTNPIVEAVPNDNSERMMSILHSFYSWGFVGVTILAALYFYVIGIENWRWLTLLWCILPLYNFIQFLFVPLPTVIEEVEEPLRFYQLLTKKTFWTYALMMFSAGASEMALSQWLSLFMEETVGLTKAVGDLAGPLSFAVMMGLARTYFGFGSHRLSIRTFIKICLVALTLAIVLMSWSPSPWLSLFASALYGGAVGILWPGTYSLATQGMSHNGPMMFGLLALVGDLGCTIGPFLIGRVASYFANDFRIGILTSLLFPLIFAVMLGAARVTKNS
ncbi:MFS transporter [Aerococcaceae bacterium zg-ZJ1578]|uniref:MFS transporter n=1 Tax=Aerococcaceae TaxID=186827 RepID=UPI0013BDE267|nr:MULTISPECIES: MFS transporter [unclassified Facklamia]MBK0347023.1 MFS transporter [Aerococcaceae bacterium zg-1578]NEW65167.1 MFS transporter [Facklamia sp. 252]NEW68558.1 MFS transporter [Facklamia sp. 253]QQD65969.1 MFS transporter [Aerococcaceae bacterium zg-252]